LVKLLVWHGRNSYKRSAKLAQFVIHRGLIIAVCQTMYSIAIKFEPEGLYKVIPDSASYFDLWSLTSIGLVTCWLCYGVYCGPCAVTCTGQGRGRESRQSLP
jgi:magnesium-transporting ATPase (P-type)